MLYYTRLNHFCSFRPQQHPHLLPDAATVASSMALSAESPAERQLLRTDFRFAPSLPQCCTGASDSVLHWVSDSALHRVFDSALHWCPCRATPHGRLRLCAVPAPRAGNTSWAPQALRCTGAPCRQQTSSGGEKYSGLASNLAHLGRIC